MHGDETANRELLLRLAAAMCGLASAGAQQSADSSSSSFAGVWGAGSGSLEGAAASQTATGAGEGVAADVVARLRALLNSTVVRIIPTMNPDG